MSIVGSDGKTMITLSTDNANILGVAAAKSEDIIPAITVKEGIENIQYNIKIDSKVNSELSINPTEIIGSVQLYSV